MLCTSNSNHRLSVFLHRTLLINIQNITDDKSEWNGRIWLRFQFHGILRKPGWWIELLAWISEDAHLIESETVEPAARRWPSFQHKFKWIFYKTSNYRNWQLQSRIRQIWIKSVLPLQGAGADTDWCMESAAARFIDAITSGVFLTKIHVVITYNSFILLYFYSTRNRYHFNEQMSIVIELG